MGRFAPSGRNFGFGKQLAYAGKNAVRDRFAGGHFASVAAYSKRWARFTDWALEEAGVRDAREVTLEILVAYGAELRDAVAAGELSVGYSQACLSAVNVVLEYMRGDRRVWLSPTATVGPRSAVRTDAPIWLDRAAIQAVVDALCGELGRRVTAMIWCARELGLRWRECALLNAAGALAGALARREIRIVRGTKGGQPRVLTITGERPIEALRYATEVQGRNDNLIEADTNYRSFAERASRAFYAAGGRHFHDLRASYACERYQSLTGWAAPVLGGMAPDREADRAARLTISSELGHHRVDVVAAYVGGRR